MNYRTLIMTAFAGAAFLAMTANAEDQGAAIAVAAQDGPSAVSVPADNFVSAEQKVKDQLTKLGLNPEGGYDRAKKAIIQIGTASLSTPVSPAGDDSFMIKRSAKATEAYLMAKADIIKAFYTEMSAADQVAYNDGNPSEAEQAVKAKIEGTKEKIAAFAEKAGKPELADADLDESLVTTLKGLTFDAPAPTPPPEGGDNEPPQGNPLATERDALVAEIQSVINEAKAIPREPMNDNTSTAKLLSKMPLLGAKILTQAESWDKTEKLYEISMAVIWSPKLQEEAKNLATGNPTIAEKKGKFSVQEWMQRQDLLSMVGPWSFTDKEGKNIVIGIAARDISGLPAPKLKGAKIAADTAARVAVATSLTCDLAAFTETSTRLAEYDDGSSEASEKVTDVVSSKTEVSLSGVLKLASKEGYHPITGRKTYAVAFFLEPDLSKDAMERIKKMYADAITVENASKFKKGQMDGMAAKLEEAKASTEKYEEGKAEAASDVAGRVRAEEVNAKATGPQGSSGKNRIGEKGGVVSGVDLDTVDLDF